MTLCSLLILITGGVAFFQPFSSLNARLHIVFGVVFGFFLVVHIVQQQSRFLRYWKVKKWKAIAWAFAVFTILIAITWMNFGLINKMMTYSYEERNKEKIFRAHPKSVFQKLDSELRLNRSDDNVGAYLEIELCDKVECDDLMIAIWVEDDRGRLIETLYLSSQLAYSEELNLKGLNLSRRVLLPVWWYKWREMIKEQKIASQDNEVMALSSASIYGSFSLDTTIKEGLSNFRICIEINQLNDENDLFREDSPNFMAQSPKGIGQPSVIYSSYIDLHTEYRNEYSLLEFLGHSDVAGEDGELTRSHSGLTSSLQLLRKALLRISIQ